MHTANCRQLVALCDHVCLHWKTTYLLHLLPHLTVLCAHLRNLSCRKGQLISFPYCHLSLVLSFLLFNYYFYYNQLTCLWSSSPSIIIALNGLHDTYCTNCQPFLFNPPLYLFLSSSWSWQFSTLCTLLKPSSKFVLVMEKHDKNGNVSASASFCARLGYLLGLGDRYAANDSSR